jgi:hypothetical protein
MIKCKECGFESNRLQWTHFRYKCSGRFKNGREYQQAYPDAPLVDPELAKKTAVTKENFIKKYGEEDGLIRWDTYCQKQAETNSFEYKNKKFGWTEDQFNDYNKSRAVTLENMIEKYGETDGIEKWSKYCDQQRYTKTKDYLISKYGEQVGTQKYLDINRKKSEPHDPKQLSKKLGITVDQAVELICSRGAYKYTSNLEQEFVALIEQKIGALEHVSTRSPFGKWDHTLSRYVVYDVKHKDCIIEFNGDYWHANPRFYSATDKIRGRLASEIWQRDTEKLCVASNAGFRVLVVWESDFLENREKIIEDTIKWILNEPQ